MQMRDMRFLWNYASFTKGVKQHYGLDSRRHIRYDRDTHALFYVVKRANPPENGGSGRFAVCEHTLNWADKAVQRGQASIAYLVLVEVFNSNPPPIVYYSTVRMALDKLNPVPPQTGAEDGNTYWWVDDEGEAQTGFGTFGPKLDTPPF